MDKQTFSELIPILGISIGLVYALSWPINNWLRMRYGHAPEAWDEEAAKIKALKGRVDALEKMAARSSDLEEKVAHLEDRVRTLEKIATDPSKRLADEIDNLRAR